MNKIGIVGCGWLGFPLAESFVESNFLVHGSTTSPDKILKLKASGIVPFLFYLPTTSNDLKECIDVDYLIINIPPGRKDPDLAKNFPLKIDSILKVLPDQAKIIFVSSTSVYGAAEGEVNERSEPFPNTTSGQVLWEVEKKLLGTKSEKKTLWSDRTTVLRLSGLVGEDRIPGRFFAGKKDISLGDAPVNIIHQDDCIKAIKEIISQEKWGKLYNLSADSHPSKRIFYSKACSDAGFQAPAFLKGGEKMKVINSDQIKQELGFKLQHPDPMSFTF